MDNNMVSCTDCLICFTFPTLVSETSCCHRSKGKLDSVSHFCSLSSIHILNSILIGKVSKQNGDCYGFSMERSFSLLEDWYLEGLFESRLSSSIRGRYYVDLERVLI